MPRTVLILLDYYLPGYRAGGPVRAIANVIEWLGDEFHIRVLTRDRDLGDSAPYPDLKPGKWYPVGKAQVRYLEPREIGINSLRKLLNRIDYDVLYLNSAFATLTVFSVLLDRMKLIPNRPIIVAPRGCLSSGAMAIKVHKKLPFVFLNHIADLYRNVVWQATSDSEAADINRVFGCRARRVAHTANLPPFFDIAYSVRDSRKRSGCVKVVCLSRISRMKNHVFLLESLRAVRGEVTVDLWGPIEDQDYWKKCQNIIVSLPDNISVRYRGSVPSENVTETLAEYDLFYLPTLGENFGHAILEALTAGCPVLISDKTPWSEVQEHSAGWALPLEERHKFGEVIQQMVDADVRTWHNYSARARAFGASYIANTSAVADMKRLFTEIVSSPTRE